MKIFLDTADTELIHKYNETGLIDGITTNPTLIMKSGRKPDDVYQEIKDMGIRDISMEVMGNADEMIAEGRRLFETFGFPCTVKVPMTRDGIEACRQLSYNNIRVNVTLSSVQLRQSLQHEQVHTMSLLLWDVLDDQSVAGLEVVRSISELYRIQGAPTQILSASIRSVQRAVRSWYNGASVVTMPPKVFDQMYDHILTDMGMAIFENDWKGVQQ